MILTRSGLLMVTYFSPSVQDYPEFGVVTRRQRGLSLGKTGAVDEKSFYCCENDPTLNSNN